LHFDFFQNDYDIKWDILECSSHNKSIYKRFECGAVWYNRSLRVMNYTFELLIDMGDKPLVSVEGIIKRRHSSYTIHLNRLRYNYTNL
ncbi:hypothetical protein ILUMI_07423, partial [Ignelater luminosus]